MTVRKKEVYMTEDTRIALLEQSIGNINQTLIRIENRLDKMDFKIDDRFEKLDSKIDDRFKILDSKMNDRFEKLDLKIDINTNRLDSKIDNLESNLASKIDSVQNKLWYLVLSAFGGLAAACAFLVIKIMHWG